MGKHYIPQFLLRKFEDPNHPGFIWQHDKKGSPPIRVKIVQAAQEKNFYGPETENRLTNEVENPGNAAMQCILDNLPLSLEHQINLAVYIGTMIRRVPFHRQWADTFSKEVFPEVLANCSHEVREMLLAFSREKQLGPEWILERTTELDQTIEKYSKTPPNSVFKQVKNPFPSDAIVAALLDMTWRIVRSSGPQYFIISDNPASYFPWEGYGLAGEETEIVFPISQQLALHGSRQRAPKNFAYVDARQNTIREINKRIVSQASRFVFTPDKPAWVSVLLPKKNLGMMRLGWE